MKQGGKARKGQFRNEVNSEEGGKIGQVTAAKRTEEGRYKEMRKGGGEMKEERK